MPRSSNSKPLPTVTSFTVDEHRTSPGLWCQGADPGADHDADTADAVLGEFHLARVTARSDLDPERPNVSRDPRGTADGACRHVERREEPIAGRVDLASFEAAQLRPHEPLELAEELHPSAIAELDGLLGGPDDVDEHDRHQCSIGMWVGWVCVAICSDILR